MTASTHELPPEAPPSPIAAGRAVGLRRSLGFADLLVYGLVFISPTAPFSIFGVVYDLSHGMVPLTYLVGLVAMGFTALSYREMAIAFPFAGSVYAYARGGIHPAAGFLAGWTILLDYLLVPALCYVTGAAALHSVLPGVPQALWIVGFILFNTAVNARGVRTTAIATRIFLAVKLVIVAAFLVLGALAISRGVGGAHWSLRPVFDPAAFEPRFIFAALSVAALSFLGFDAIATLAEEATGGGHAVGRSMLVALALAATLFVAQTWVAALLVPGGAAFVGDTAMNDAFYSISAIAGGELFKAIVAFVVAIAAAIATALVAQAATARLLFAMARDGQLPRALAHVHPERRVPERALLLVSAVSLVLGVFFAGKLALLSSLVNFGALFAFLMLHVAVVLHWLVRQRSRRLGVHLVSPVLGFAVIAMVLANADIHARTGGLAWLAIGVVVLIGLRLAGRAPALEPALRKD